MAKIRLTQENAQQELDGLQGAALLDFGAPWCGYCRRIAPAVDMVAQEWDDVLPVLEIDVDELPDMATRYGVEGVPTFVFLEDGEPRGTLTGADSKAALDAFIRENMG